MIIKNTLLRLKLIKLFFPYFVLLRCFPVWLLFKSNFGGCSARGCGKLKRTLPEICDRRPCKAVPLEAGRNYESKVAPCGNHFALSAASLVAPLVNFTNAIASLLYSLVRDIDTEEPEIEFFK